MAKIEHSLPDHRSAGVALWVKPPLEGRQAGSLPNQTVRECKLQQENERGQIGMHDPVSARFGFIVKV